MSVTTLRDGKIRLYNDTGTPYYLELDLDMGDFNAPIGAPLTDEILILDRGKMSADAHYIEGDEYKLMEPVDLSFSVKVRDDAQTGYLLDVIDVLNKSGSTTVNSNTWATTEADTQRDGSNNNPVFADANKGTLDIHYLLDTGGTDRGWRWNECYIPINEVSFAEGDAENVISIAAKCYGTIARITAWLAGTNVEA